MLSVRSLHKSYVTEGGQVVRAVSDVSFEVPRGKMFALLGPSGCGKTTTLRSIAGLEKPDAGEISVDGKIVFSAERRIHVPPEKRDFGMVFQSYAIWPHMTVYQNAAFPLRVGKRRVPARQMDEAVARALHIVALDGLEDRKATQLSGGQQQRLALARALIKQPPLLLLDEPLSNLDAKLRERMRFELKRLQRELDLTTIYVTHDQMEALALSHQIAVMSGGEIVQIGSPREIYERPKSRFVADFVGSTNFIPAEVLAAGEAGASITVRLPFGVLDVQARDSLSIGDAVMVSIRPEHIEITDRRSDGPNVWEGRIANQIFLGERQDVQVAIGDVMLQVQADAGFDAAPGRLVYLGLDGARCVACAE
jgi:iron(III) transport system ATP-binding protein